MRNVLTLIAIAITLVACMSEQALRQSRIEIEAGNEEAGLARLAEEVDARPDDAELRNDYLRYKAVAAQRYLALGDNARAAGALERAAEAYARVLRIDPENERAKAGLATLNADRKQRRTLGDAA
jgi:general secretion pathway protein D